ncbi:efflux RND transporter periplasmic adaptor subunit [Thiomicrorhabdus sediminis]|uniref:Efflux RND transporter periplasmic adaptor subunit n=1 Tax=Thiomicrorhabdus sediminis TaxID=2580412 RepID=A0A4P9K3B8_9GAMM|nr:efflux RND transporter periplasmic adaptor subunit [Thiomicrorhabdus sediminis]QCU89352.1 efflux RND transporter periplasmic adaptor subunit [Thiomicrorhabdus sediminis]
MLSFLQAPLQKIKRLLIPVIIIVAALALFIYMKSTKPQQPAVEISERVWMVETLSAKFENLSPVQTLYGQVESNSLVSLAAPVSGVVAKLNVKEGDEVKKGELLLKLSDADIEAPLLQAKAAYELQKLANKANIDKLAHEQNVLKLKQQALARAKQLMARDLASQSSVDAAEEALAKQEFVVVGAELAVKQNQPLLAQAKASLIQAQANFERGNYQAPYDARIAKVSVSEGSRVNAGTQMLTFYALDSMELRAKLPTAELQVVQQALQNKQKLVASYSGLSSVSKGAQSRVELPLLRLSGQASTSGVDAFFALPKALQDRRPGELMEISLQGLAYHNVAAVPYSALYGSDKVYIVENERLQAKDVVLLGEVMREGKLWALIKPSFAAGAKIAITHLPNAVTGLKVTEAN